VVFVTPMLSPYHEWDFALVWEEPEAGAGVFVTYFGPPGYPVGPDMAKVAMQAWPVITMDHTARSRRLPLSKTRPVIYRMSWLQSTAGFEISKPNR